MRRFPVPDQDRPAAPVWRTAVRRVCLLAAALVMGVMVWTAAHDVARGERDLTAEWTLLVFAGLLGVCAAMGWAMRSTEPRR